MVVSTDATHLTYIKRVSEKGIADMDKLLLIDGHSILNRAFYALPLLKNKQGVYTNAVYGFINMLQKFIETESPDYLTVAFDVHAKTFRHQMYEAYKGTRKPMAEELRMQVPMIKQLLKAMDITVIEKEGLEADDILGTLAKRAEAEGLNVTIVSGDRDLLQLATEHIKISISKTSKAGTQIEDYFAKDVLEKKGVTPTEFIDVKALWGDTSDNIPGVPGIGEKTATSIIAQYKSLENAYAHVDELKPPRAAQNLKEYYDQAVLSKDLATIRINADVDYRLSDAQMKNIYTKDAYALCMEWELKSLIAKFELSDTKESKPQYALVSVLDKETLDKVLADVYLSPTKASDEIVYGISVVLSQKEPIKLCVAYQNTVYSIKSSLEDDASQLTKDDLWDVLLAVYKAVSDQPALKRFACFGLKELMQAALFNTSLTIHKPLIETARSFYDLSVMAYLLHPLGNAYTPGDVALDVLQSPIEADKEAEAYIAAKALLPMLERLQNEEMEALYTNVEGPLIFCLATMEREGMAVDKDALKAYSEGLEKDIAVLEQKIYDAAGETFNILSPKQLGEILYNKLQIPGGKKTKTGYSTAADVLEKQAEEYPIIGDVLAYRTLTKLKSTYADGLVSCIAEDGRIHTTFQQTVTATGRLSSTEPNLQNIPIRLEQGKQIRKVFHPKDGYVFVDADYSQIELRVLAHMSSDENLIKAYRQNQDIHRATASLVFHTPFEEVTDLQRSNAKAVNFGIVYGISSFGLGNDLNITRKEAQKYIDDYFIAYPKLKLFLDDLVQTAKKTGVAHTLLNRKRPIPEITEKNFMRRSFGERIAMNSPIQGSAADIIKIAMIRVFDRLLKENLSSKLILQVHDELLIEAKDSEADLVKEILVQEMQQAYALSVPLIVDVHTGNTWYDAK